MATPDGDLLRRLDRLYGRAFLLRLVAVGEEARRVADQGGQPPPEILVRVRLRHGRAVLTMVEPWRPVA